MGYVLIVSLPMVIFFSILCFGCYVKGRNKGQQEGRAMAAQELGINNPQSPAVLGAVSGGGGFVMATTTSPPPPSPPQYPAPAFPSPSPHHPNPPMYLKQQQKGINVV